MLLMRKVQVITTKIQASILFKSIIFNLIVIGSLFIFFEPVAKVDDQDMCDIVYGVYTGEYSSILLYSNILLGKFFVFLLKLFPSVSWYWITYFLFMFISFVSITYILLKRFTAYHVYYLSAFFLGLAGYVFYIKCTFTKVAGLLVVAGLLLIFYAIEQWKKLVLCYISGIILVTIGMMIRSSVLELIFVIFFSMFLIYCFSAMKQKKEIWNQIILFIILVLFFLVEQKALEKISWALFDADENWSNYMEYHSAQVQMYDYIRVNYEQHPDQFEELGVSSNDYAMWFDVCFTLDSEILTADLMTSIANIHTPKRDESLIDILTSASRDLGKSLKESVLFYCMLICGFFTIIFEPKRMPQRVILVNIFCIFCYYYMYWNGRVKTHVNEILFLAGTVAVLYLCDIQNNRLKFNLHINSILLISVLVGIYGNYKLITASDYEGRNIKSQKEAYKENYKYLSLMSEDLEHVYIQGYRDSTFRGQSFTTFQMREKGFYSNFVRSTWTEDFATSAYTYSKYNIHNPVKELPNSNLIYYCTSLHWINEGHGDIIAKYFQEHYNLDVYYSIVKQIGDLCVVRFTSGDIILPWNEDEVIETANIISDISIHQNEDGVYDIDGYAFLNGIDSYAQNIYIQSIDRSTGDSTYSYVTQTENKLFSAEDKYHGKYSSFYGQIKQNSLETNLDFYLYIDTENGTYKLAI